MRFLIVPIFFLSLGAANAEPMRAFPTGDYEGTTTEFGSQDSARILVHSENDHINYTIESKKDGQDIEGIGFLHLEFSDGGKCHQLDRPPISTLSGTCEDNMVNISYIAKFGDDTITVSEKLTFTDHGLIMVSTFNDNGRMTGSTSVLEKK